MWHWRKRNMLTGDSIWTQNKNTDFSTAETWCRRHQSHFLHQQYKQNTYIMNPLTQRHSFRIYLLPLSKRFFWPAGHSLRMQDNWSDSMPHISNFFHDQLLIILWNEIFPSHDVKFPYIRLETPLIIEGNISVSCYASSRVHINWYSS